MPILLVVVGVLAALAGGPSGPQWRLSPGTVQAQIVTLADRVCAMRIIAADRPIDPAIAIPAPTSGDRRIRVIEPPCTVHPRPR